MKPWLIAWFLTSSCVAQRIYVPPPMPKPVVPTVKPSPAPTKTAPRATANDMTAGSAAGGAASQPTAVPTNGTAIPNPSWPGWEHCGLNPLCYSGGQAPSTAAPNSGARQPVSSSTGAYSSVVTFNPNGTVTTHIVPTALPPSVVDFNRQAANSAALAQGLANSLDQIQTSDLQSQAVAQSLNSALDNQLNSGGSLSANTAPGESPSSADAQVEAVAQGSAQIGNQTAQSLAQSFLDHAAGLLAPPDPLEVGAETALGVRLARCSWTNWSKISTIWASMKTP